ncbi:MAG: septal ring lytic transglycosylase RlpA family protein, partial [Bacteroidota bacterium]
MKNYLLTLLCVLCTVGSLSAQRMEGLATFYADKFEGKNTSTGERFTQNGYSAASKDFAWGTILEVTNLSNGKAVHVRVNDCGPHKKGRIIDLSKQAAKDLDFIKQGEVTVSLRVVRASNAGPTCSRGAWANRLKKAGLSVPPPPGPWRPSDTPGLVTTTQAPGPAPTVRPTSMNTVAPPSTTDGSVRAMASYYADRFNGRPTSTGETYDARELTAASKAYPYNTLLEVANAATGAKVIVRVNDCGPHNPERLLDLSKAAATQIGVARAGVAAVDVRVVRLGTDGPTCNRSAWSAENETATPSSYGTTLVVPTADPIPPAALSEYDFATAYYVQLGAFSAPASAENVARRAFARGYTNAHYAYDPQTQLFVAKLRRFYDKASGKQMQAQLAKDGFRKTSLKETKTPGLITSKMAGKVTTKGFAPDEVVTNTAYLVQLGAFASTSSAEGLAKAARKAGYTDPHVYFNHENKLHTAILYTYYDEGAAKQVQGQLMADGFANTSLTEEYTVGELARLPRSKQVAKTPATGPATYSTVAVPGSVPAYKLQLGAFKKEGAAYQLFDQLEAKNYVDAAVYKNPATGLFTALLTTPYNKVTAKTVQAQLTKDGFKSSLKEDSALPQDIQTEAVSKASPTPASTTTMAPAPAPKSYDKDAILFGVQVGAFSTAAGAAEAKTKLAAAGVTEVYDAKVGKVTRVF